MRPRRARFRFARPDHCSSTTSIRLNFRVARHLKLPTLHAFHGNVGFVILTKDELIHALQNEVRILLHLISKVDPATLDYRLSPKQRSLLELLQYLVFMPEVHMRAALADSFSLDGFQTAWQAGEATANAMNLAQITEAIGRQRALIEELLSPCSDADLRAQIEMFGNKASRGSMLVLLVLSHYAAYRMQLFLYLKAAGRAELSTFNLWLGADALP
ncbi:MAG: hypothetical protein WB987_13185 [Candidatus Acidiferrales bacterium]